MQPKDFPQCVGCGERKHPDQLVDGFCRDGRYAQPLPRRSCVETASAADPFRWSQTVASVRAAQALTKDRWHRLKQAQAARGARRREVA